MADFYDRMTALGFRLIAKYGQPAIHRRLEVSGADPDTPWIAEGEPPVETNVVIAFVPVDRYAWETMRMREGTDITEGHLTGYMGASLVPNVKDVIIRAGRQLTIDDVITINPAGRDVLHIMLLRQ